MKLTHLKILLCMFLGLFFSQPMLAEEPDVQEFEAAPEPPDLPSPVESGEALEPEVTIIRRDDAVIEEYRVNGVLYKVKVTPSVGPVYYLIDRNGDGRMERMSDLSQDLSVPQWILLEW